MELTDNSLAAISQISWAVVALIIAIRLINQISNWLGAIQYKRLTFIYAIKEHVYWLVDLYRSRLNGRTSLDDDDFSKIYNTLVGSNNAVYDLNNFVQRYSAYCPQLKTFKVRKMNRKIKDASGKKQAVMQYYNDVNALITTCMAGEYLKSREDLQLLGVTLSNCIANL